MLRWPHLIRSKPGSREETPIASVGPCHLSAVPPPAPRRLGGGDLRLTVWRRIDDYHRGLADHSPMARELHRRRLAALTSALASSSTCTVTDWGTDDGTGAPLKASLRLRPCGRGERAGHPPPAPLRQLARILGADGVRDETVAAVLWLIRRLRSPQRQQRILDHEIALPGGQTLWSDPDGEHLLITVTLAGGERRHVHWWEPSADGSDRGRPAHIRL